MCDEFSRTNTIPQRHGAICSLIHHIITEFELVALVVARTPTSIKIVSFFSSLLLFSIRSIRDQWSWFRTTSLFGSAMDQTILNVSQSSSHRCPINLTAPSLTRSLTLTLRNVNVSYHLDHWPLIWFMNFSIKRNKNYGWLVLSHISGVDTECSFFSIFLFRHLFVSIPLISRQFIDTVVISISSRRAKKSSSKCLLVADSSAAATDIANLYECCRNSDGKHRLVMRFWFDWSIASHITIITWNREDFVAVHMRIGQSW